MKSHNIEGWQITADHIDCVYRTGLKWCSHPDCRIKISKPSCIKTNCPLAALAPEPITNPETKLRQLIADTCEDDTAIRDIARKYLPEHQVDGDSFWVPGLVTVVQDLVTALTGSDRPEVNLRKEIINIQVDVEKMTQACEMEYNPEFRDEWIYKLAHRDCRHAAAEIVAGRWRKVEP